MSRLEDMERRIYVSENYNFFNHMAYFYTRENLDCNSIKKENKTEYRIPALTIGEMNLIREAIRHYQYEVLDKIGEWDGIRRNSNDETSDQITKRCNYECGYTKQNCDKVMAKILGIQLEIYEWTENNKEP